MSNAIMHCERCRGFTLKKRCACGQPTIRIIPPKYSPDDRHAGLTRQAKEAGRKEKGLI